MNNLVMLTEPFRECSNIPNDNVTDTDNSSSEEISHKIDTSCDNSHISDNIDVAASGNRPLRQKREPSWLRGDEWEK